jgi:DNA repair exonuclease SbcCD ATPase subunit
MARPGIGYEEVKAAAVQLLEQGVNPSIQRVRELLGTGSNSTIGDHLKRWQQNCTERPRLTLPAAVPQALTSAVESFWQVALEQAETQYQQLRAEAEQAVETAEQARDEAIKAMERAREQASGLQQQWERSQREARECADQLLVERERRALAEAEIKAAEQRAVAAAQLTEQVRTEAEIRFNKLEDALRQGREEAEQRLATAEQRLLAERERSEGHEQRLMRVVEQNRAEHTLARQEFNEERLTWRSREAALQQQVENAQDQLTRNRQTTATAEERARLLEMELKQARVALHDLQERQLTTAGVVESLKVELKMAHDEQHNLRQHLTDVSKGISTKPAPEEQSQ